MRGAADRDKEQNPGLAMAGNLVGGSLLPFGLMGNVVKGASLGQKVWQGGRVGAGIGATQGLSEARDLTDYADAAKHAGVGAAAGSFIGGGVPILGAGLGTAYRMAAPMLSRPVDGMSRVTTTLLANALSRRSSDALDKYGSQAMLADASPSMQGFAMGVAGRPGPSADALGAALLERHEGQAGRLAGDLDANLGPAISPRTIDATMDAKQAATGPMFDRALASRDTVDITPVTQGLENTRLYAKGSRHADHADVGAL